MKRKQYFLIAVLGSIAVLSSCKVYRGDGTEGAVPLGQTFKDYCGEYADGYEVLGEEDNKILVRVSAPDFPVLVEEMYLLEEGEPFSLTGLKEMVEFHPNYRKEYEFLVEKEEAEEIRKKLLDTVAKDMMVHIIQQIDCSEEEDKEE